MAYIALYWCVMLLGYFFGSKLRSHKEQMGFTNTLMLVFVSLLVLLMGMRMGSNEDVIANLGTIGVESLAITVLVMAGAVAAVTVTRKLLGMDKYGQLVRRNGTAGSAGGPAVQPEQASAGPDAADAGPDAADAGADAADGPDQGGSSNLMTWLILIFTVVGLLLGYLVIRVRVQDFAAFDRITNTCMTVTLCLLLHVIGLDMGLTGTVVQHLKHVGLRVIAFPVAVLVGTTLMGILVGLLFGDLTVREALAVSYGFGWYTFAPVSITNAGHVMAGAISFMHNVFREMAGIVLIPVLAKRLGYIEVTSLPGVAAMDVCLPIVERATRQDIVVYSFAVGMSQGLAVPLLVPLSLGA